MMLVFKMCDSVPSARYSSVCNVLRLWRISLIPTYRVYRLYDKYVQKAGEPENDAGFLKHNSQLNYSYSYPSKPRLVV